MTADSRLVVGEGSALGQPIAAAVAEATRERRIDVTYLGVLLFISSEAMFFAGLFAVFFNAKAMHPQWPPPNVHLEIGLPIVLTIVLVTSSFTMQHAIRQIRRGDHVGLTRGLVITVLLGISFLAGQLFDYATLGFSFSSGPYGAAFFTLTGFHGAHVLAGVLLLSAMIVRSTRGQFSAGHHAAIEGVGAYWHFVDIIWLLVFSSIYLLR
jgi:cytochrome c oxidase subunit 3